MVEPAIEIVMPQMEEKGIRLVRMFPEIHVGAECDPHLLKVVVVNLLGNAVSMAGGDRSGFT